MICLNVLVLIYMNNAVQQRNSILDYFPEGKTPFSHQQDILASIERAWPTAQVIVVSAPTASGKSYLATTIGQWANSQGQRVSVITSTRQLQDQYLKDFPNIPNLKGADAYPCHRRAGGCGGIQMQGKTIYCPRCPYAAERKKALTADLRFFNYHSYYAHSIRPVTERTSSSEVLIVDEAHNLLSVISDFSSLKFWQHIHHYPDNLHTVGDIAVWLSRFVKELPTRIKSPTYSSSQRKKLQRQLEQYKIVLRDVEEHYNDFYHEHSVDYYRGRKLPYLSIQPVTIKHLPPKFWPSTKVKKIILMSATLTPQDIEELGLAVRRPVYLECKSPIDPKRRPFIVQPIADLAYRNRADSLPLIAQQIREYTTQHSDQKGFIHCSYSLARLLRQHLPEDRFMWHTKDNKADQFTQFMQAKEPLIFVASGMEEGIDLVQDAARWQVLVAVPYLNWRDGWVRAKTERDESWYHRMAARTIQQQAGRICRTPQDTGITYMLDSRFPKFFYERIESWPKWFLDSIVWT